MLIKKNRSEDEQIQEELKKALDTAKRGYEQSSQELKRQGEVTEETKKNVDAAIKKMTAIEGQLSDIVQKMDRNQFSVQRSRGDGSLGSDVVSSEVFKSAGIGSSWRGEASFEVSSKSLTRMVSKAVTTDSGSGSSASSALVPADRRGGIVSPPEPAIRIRQMLGHGNTSSNAVEYTRELTFTNSAGFVAENPTTSYPESDLKFELDSVFVRDISHIIPISQKALDDAPLIQSYINGRMIDGLMDAEDRALLAGDGKGVNIKGLLSFATAYQKPTGIVVEGETVIDRLRLAILQAAMSNYSSTGIILNPIDWANISLTKDKENRYIFTNPTVAGLPTLWGLPVAQSTAMPVGTFLTGGLTYGAEVVDRQDATIEISTQNKDYFEKGMVCIRAIKRLALTSNAPGAIIYGSTKMAAAQSTDSLTDDAAAKK